MSAQHENRETQHSADTTSAGVGALAAGYFSGATVLVTGGTSGIGLAAAEQFARLGARVAYSAAKGGVVQLTKSLAEAWAGDGIRVNSVAPGWIETPLAAGLDEAAKERILSRTPAGRFGRPEVPRAPSP